MTHGMTATAILPKIRILQPIRSVTARADDKIDNINRSINCINCNKKHDFKNNMYRLTSFRLWHVCYLMYKLTDCRFVYFARFISAFLCTILASLIVTTTEKSMHVRRKVCICVTHMFSPSLSPSALSRTLIFSGSITNVNKSSKHTCQYSTKTTLYKVTVSALNSCWEISKLYIGVHEMLIVFIHHNVAIKEKQ